MQPLEMEPRGGHESDSRVIVFVPGCPAGEGQEPGWPGVAAHAYDITSRRIADERNGKEIPHSFVGARLAQSWTRPRGRATTLSSDTSPWTGTRDSEVRTPSPSLSETRSSFAIPTRVSYANFPPQRPRRSWGSFPQPRMPKAAIETQIGHINVNYTNLHAQTIPISA